MDEPGGIEAVELAVDVEEHDTHDEHAHEDVQQHPELEQADLLRIFMDFMWIGLERHSRGRHWTAGGSPRERNGQW